MRLHLFVLQLLNVESFNSDLTFESKLEVQSGTVEEWTDAYDFAVALHAALPFLTTLRKTSVWEQLPDRVKINFEKNLTKERMILCLLAEELQFSVQLLAQNKVPVIVLKGMDLSHRFYPDKMLRPMTDVDLLVKEESFKKAVQVLLKAGYKIIGKQRNDRYRIEMSRFEDGLAVELHSRLLLSDEKSDLIQYWEQSVPHPLSGFHQDVRVLSSQDLLVYLIRHATVQHRLESPIWLNDIYYLLQAIIKNEVYFDWDLFLKEVTKRKIVSASWFTLSLLPCELVPVYVLKSLHKKMGYIRFQFLRAQVNWVNWFLTRRISKLEIFKIRFLLRDNSFQFAHYLKSR